jgi:hypothetical protein
MRSLVSLAVVALLLGSATVTEVRAQDTKAQVKRLLADGDKLAKKKDLEGAVAKYQEAADLEPSLRTMVPLAATQEKLGRDLEAITTYETLLAIEGAVPLKQKAEIEGKLAELEKRVAVINFQIIPDGATVSIDDVEIGTSPLPRPVRLMPGDHKYAVSLTGYLIARKAITLAAGDRIDEVVSLEKEVEIEVQPPPDQLPPPEVSHPEARPGRAVLLGGIITTSALGAAAIITGVMAISAHSTYVDESNSTQDREDARTSGKTLALTTDILIAGTLVAGGFTAYWYLTHRPARSHSSEETTPAAEPEPSTALAPYVTPDGAGIAVFGRF